ncbi:MAG: biotin--[acetyl-CoA-carboxylase] ligase [Elusimicrobia bacterium]|nr:biotin--[acetyl-CoA-carboxylase] ligase [Elusimicrobiota bacterium]
MKEKILQMLRAEQAFVSGQRISRALQVSRAAVWKAVEALRQEGYAIEAVSRRGYRLASVPDKVSSAEVQFHLGTRVLGRHVHHFETLPSTMDEAFRLAGEGAPEGTIVIAEAQTRGRGRLGRSWVSPKGKGLYFSLILRPSCPLAEIPRLTLLAAVAVSEAVEAVSGVRLLIKWPNDLLFGKKKVVGILTEMRAEMDRVDFVVLGIGANIQARSGSLPPEAIALEEAAACSLSRVALLQEMLRILEKWYSLAGKNGFAEVLKVWRERSATLGQRVHFEDRGRNVSGKAVGLADDGGLLVELSDGTVVKRISGEVLL